MSKIRNLAASLSIIISFGCATTKKYLHTPYLETYKVEQLGGIEKDIPEFGWDYQRGKFNKYECLSRDSFDELSKDPSIFSPEKFKFQLDLLSEEAERNLKLFLSDKFDEEAERNLKLFLSDRLIIYQREGQREKKYRLYYVKQANPELIRTTNGEYICGKADLGIDYLDQEVINEKLEYYTTKDKIRIIKKSKP